MNTNALSRSRGCLIGLAVGDAVGTTVEFESRDSFTPLTDMVGGGPFRLKIGEWTDDTSMALCLAHSLVETRGFDPADQMNRYCDWYLHGYMSSNGRCFDIGNTVKNALETYLEKKQPFAGVTNPLTAGNGSIMRLAPVPIFYQRNAMEAEKWSAESSRTTHGAAECILACQMLARILVSALSGATKTTVLESAGAENGVPAGKLKDIAQLGYLKKSEAQVRGSGYVVDSLEAALWAFAKTDSFRDAILAAANLGDDADTTAAVCGQIAGAYYGLEGIPAGWLSKLVMRDEIIELADKLYEAAQP